MKLHRRWGTTIPGGSCATVGAGGHIVGGGYGLLSRRNGLTVDHLHGVEVVTAGADDRTPPRELLPRAPRQVLLHDITIGWDQVGSGGAEPARMLRRFSRWCECRSTPGSTADNQLFALFRVFPQLTSDSRAINLTTQVAIDDDAPESLTRARATLRAPGTGVPTTSRPTTAASPTTRWTPWSPRSPPPVGARRAPGCPWTPTAGRSTPPPSRPPPPRTATR
ncbi:hypothetical protein AB0G02_15010 [Actinosynnema sp. NPDC023658]|uniref:hypothetical protein n=1 Tax=Actinosynnema sp. NPDC023658 TaxID=3155465 RepID=UPI0033D486FD